MSDNLVLELLRAIQGDLAQLRADGVEVKERLGLLEGLFSSIFRRADRLVGDVEHIKRRLEITEAPISL